MPLLADHGTLSLLYLIYWNNYGTCLADYGSDSGSYTMNMIFVLSIYYANNGICNMPQRLLFLGPLNATFWDVSKYQKNEKRP